jgi:hypothetical protein
MAVLCEEEYELTRRHRLAKTRGNIDQRDPRYDAARATQVQRFDVAPAPGAGECPAWLRIVKVGTRGTAWQRDGCAALRILKRLQNVVEPMYGPYRRISRTCR